jgi:ABC-type uncharacterized transport system substrate-binding protein
MDRRRFVGAMVCVTVAAPLVTKAQTMATVRRIGFLRPAAPDPPEELLQFVALRKLGWIDGQNLLVEQRYANSKAELLRPLAEELVRLRVDLIVTAGTSATLAAKRATNTIPIVFWSAADPVRTGLVASLARPGGNVTGFSVVITELEAKRLALLREWVPAVRRIGRLENPSNPYYRATRKDFEQACRSLSVQPIFVEVAAAGDLANAIAEVPRRGGDGLLVGPDPLFYDNRATLMRAALGLALPTTVSRDFIHEVGALVAYNHLESEEDERGAAMIDRILRGARPADLPVEQPTKFELILNLKTAKALGIAVPPTLLSRADEVIR